MFSFYTESLKNQQKTQRLLDF